MPGGPADTWGMPYYQHEGDSMDNGQHIAAHWAAVIARQDDEPCPVHHPSWEAPDGACYLCVIHGRFHGIPGPHAETSLERAQVRAEVTL